MRIAVFCGSSRRSGELHLGAARALGTEIARSGHELVYGGGRTGLMGALADAALAAGGSVRGVILREFVEQDAHHTGLTSLDCVEDMHARKAGLEADADAFVALPGGLGTLEELAEVLSFRKLDHHRRTLVLIDVGGFYAGLRALIERAIEDGFEDAAARAYLSVTDDPVQAVRLCEASLRG